ncbi:hypothetical protein GGS23DRAFT_612184 [Durotheca rogersii]|uniref:uncharacterized protein n=1 Tax=Durotheca rogersii TaxID=419775 RepID=UPI00221E8CDD|nr:uncharacterized protein GGS23DRAFT_612184 [Durotheca rogersii]KAI5861205.1 hypothetical protein GGS23DRAFT_612184 [Durotheca rogersii]
MPPKRNPYSRKRPAVKPAGGSRAGNAKKHKSTHKDEGPSNNRKVANGLDWSLPPITNVDAAFKDLVGRRKDSFDLIADHGGFRLRIATMCSGTEAPIFAMKMLQDSYGRSNPGKQILGFDHVFSAEIEAFKQAYIARNAEGSILFNDMRDFIRSEDGKAPTAMGAVETIPGDIDVLISGCSCVDFSNLNTQKRKDFLHNLCEKKVWNDHDFEETKDVVDGAIKEAINDKGKMGQSGQTFFSMLHYVREYTPKVVILENVLGAPWSVVEKMWFPAVGYSATYMHLDTKDYYIPQTRQRGYLVALSRDAFGEDSAREILDEWRELVKNLGRRASAPILSWLLPAAHPLTERARQDDSEKALMPRKADSDWKRSKVRHARVRKQEKLGNERPLTQWGSSNGHKRPYDRMDRLVLLTQPDRVLDCIEIFYLRGLKSGLQIDGRRYKFDMLFKSRIYDLSQNIDRNLGSVPLGMAGCITPSGIHWVTDQNRILSGFETLVMQGLPLSRLDFATETQDNLRDLAGNAMTTTVVGAAFISTLIAVDRHYGSQTDTKADGWIGPFPTITSSFNFGVKAHAPIMGFEWKSVADFSTTSASTTDIPSLYTLHKRCRRYCFCNRAAKYSTVDFRRCTVCSTIRCRWCSGNPEHYVEYASRPPDFLLLSEVEHKVMSYLPSTIIKSIVMESTPNQPQYPGPAIIGDSAIMTHLASAVFYYHHIHITEIITVCYTAEGGLELRAVLSEEGLTWYMHLDAWGDLGRGFRAAHGITITQLAQPVAKARLDPALKFTLPTNESWMFWCFKAIPVEVEVSKQHGNDQLEIVTISTREEVDNLGFYPEIMELMPSICGLYEHRRKCDAPEKSLYVNSLNERRLFLFKDTTRTGMPSQDSWVVSHDCRPLEIHEYREVLIKFASGVDLHEGAKATTVKATVDGFWMPPQAFKLVRGPEKYSEILRGVEMLKVLQSKYRLVKPLDPVQCVLMDARIARHSVCDTNDIIKKYRYLAENETDDGWVTVEPFELHHLYDFISHLNVKVANIEDLKVCFEMMDAAAYNESRETKSFYKGAPPSLPQIRWVRTGSKYIAHHHSHEIAAFESEMKAQLPPFEVRVQVVPHPAVPPDMYTVSIRYLVNPKGPAYKALSYLPQRDEMGVEVHAYTRVETNVVTSENLQIRSETSGGDTNRHTFQPFFKSLRGLPTKPLAEDSRMSSFNGKLSTSQTRSLGWMLSRERGSPVFTEHEIEESIEPHLKLRLVGCAQRKICRRGGVLADDVGYGKTVVTLALIHCQEEFDMAESIERRAAENPHCRHLKASLIIVPPHLVDQWAEQAVKFVPASERHIVTIKTVSDLEDDREMSLLRRLDDARLIIVSNDIFGQVDYHFNLAKNAGCLDPPFELLQERGKTKGRALRDWYKEALSTASKYTSRLLVLKESESGDEEGLRELHVDMSENFDVQVRIQSSFTEDFNNNQPHRAPEGKASERSRDVKGKGKGKGRKEPSKEVDNPENLDDEDNDATGQSPKLTQKFPSEKGISDSFTHIFEAFSFARVIYDEFSYDNFPTALFVQHSRAYSKWVLSATPPTRNLAAVCGIADLVDIHIARPMRRRLGVPRITQGPELGEQSNAERLLAHKEFSSDQCIRERHEKGEEFLREFATSNPLDRDLAGGVTVEEVVIVCEMNRNESIHYLDLQQELRACGFDADLLPGKSRALLAPIIGHQWHGNGRAVGTKALLLLASLGKREESQQSESLLLSHRKFLLRSALATLKANADKVIWLCNRILSHAKERQFDNAKSVIGDVCTLFRGILAGDTAQCGGIHPWACIHNQVFSRSPRTDDQQDTNTPSPRPEFVLKRDADFLRALNYMRSTPWTSYYKLKPDQLNDLGENEALNLVLDVCRVYGDQLPGLKDKEPRDALRGLVENDEAELTVAAKAHNDKMTKGTAASVPSFYNTIRGEASNVRKTKVFFQELCRGAGILFDDSEKVDELSRRWDSHKAGTLDDSDYVGFDDCRLLKPERFPIFGREVQARGAKFTWSGNDVSDTSLQLRKALDQVVYALKQKRIVENLTSCEKEGRCDGCGLVKPTQRLHFVPECGHLICADHLHAELCGDLGPDGPTRCPSQLRGTTIPMSKLGGAQRTLDPDMPGRQPPPPAPPSRATDDGSLAALSSKSQMIVDTIRRIPDDEFALLFVQFDPQMEELKRALDLAGIEYTTAPVGAADLKPLDDLPRLRVSDLRARCGERGLPVDGAAKTLVQRLRDWQAQQERRGVAAAAADPKVRLLKLNDATSAGTNLQYANHVLFASPLLAGTQEEWDAYTRQARGRCVRFGQRRTVHVYHFVAAGTIEVDVLELRRRARVRVAPGRAVGVLESCPPSRLQATGEDAEDGDAKQDDDSVSSTLGQHDVWRAMNEQNWLTTVGIEY